jgi:hypothetical protein
LNPGCRGGKPATNRLSYGAALRNWFTVNNKKAAKENVFLSKKKTNVLICAHVNHNSLFFTDAVSIETIALDGSISNECGSVGGMKNWRGYLKYLEKTPPQCHSG